MKTTLIGLAALLLFAGAPGTAAAAEDTLAGTLERVSKDQIAAFSRHDVTATLGYAYTKSPAYDEAKTALPSLFSEADTKAEQVGFHYIGHDDELAVARVKVKVTAADAPGFQNNIVDAIMIFHVEDGAWKVWDSYLLGGEPVK